MHFSTFIPSALHFVIMLGAALSRPLRRVNLIAARKIQRDIQTRWPDRAFVSGWHSLRRTAPIAGVALFFWVLFTVGASPEHLSWLGEAFMWPVEGYARMIGAI